MTLKRLNQLTLLLIAVIVAVNPLRAALAMGGSAPPDSGYSLQVMTVITTMAGKHSSQHSLPICNYCTSNVASCIAAISIYTVPSIHPTGYTLITLEPEPLIQSRASPPPTKPPRILAT